MTKPDTGGRGEGRMTKAQRSILELAVSRGGTIHVFPDQISVVARLEAREWMHSNGSHLDRESTITDAGRAALQSVEGGVQGSIADGRQCNEQSGQSLSPAFGIIDPDYARIFTIARCLAWAEGYAIAMHGSFTRDLDLIAVPWAPHACEPEHLAKRIESAAGLKITVPPKNDKPHNRLVWTMTLPEFGDPRFVDLSIIPPQHEVELSEEDVRMIDQAWETHKAALPLTAEALAEEIHIQMSVNKTCVVSGANALAKALLEKFTITQLTKTPSADHDAGNLRGLADPNHQPHAASQGWRDIETAPKDGTLILAFATRDRKPVFAVTWWRQEKDRKGYTGWGEFNTASWPATHWMPLPAPPSPDAKTGGAS